MPSIFGNGQWILKTVGLYSLRKASTNKNTFANNTSNSEKKKVVFGTRTPDTSSSPRKSIQSQNVFSGATDKFVIC